MILLLFSPVLTVFLKFSSLVLHLSASAQFHLVSFLSLLLSSLTYILWIFDFAVVNLTLIDLPGLTKVAVGGLFAPHIH